MIQLIKIINDIKYSFHFLNRRLSKTITALFFVSTKRL